MRLRPEAAKALKLKRLAGGHIQQLPHLTLTRPAAEGVSSQVVLSPPRAAAPVVPQQSPITEYRTAGSRVGTEEAATSPGPPSPPGDHDMDVDADLHLQLSPGPKSPADQPESPEAQFSQDEEPAPEVTTASAAARKAGTEPFPGASSAGEPELFQAPPPDDGGGSVVDSILGTMDTLQLAPNVSNVLNEPAKAAAKADAAPASTTGMPPAGPSVAAERAEAQALIDQMVAAVAWTPDELARLSTSVGNIDNWLMAYTSNQVDLIGLRQSRHPPPDVVFRMYVAHVEHMRLAWLRCERQSEDALKIPPEVSAALRAHMEHVSALAAGFSQNQLRLVNQAAHEGLALGASDLAATGRVPRVEDTLGQVGRLREPTADERRRMNQEKKVQKEKKSVHRAPSSAASQGTGSSRKTQIRLSPLSAKELQKRDIARKDRRADEEKRDSRRTSGDVSDEGSAVSGVSGASRHVAPGCRRSTGTEEEASAFRQRLSQQRPPAQKLPFPIGPQKVAQPPPPVSRLAAPPDTGLDTSLPSVSESGAAEPGIPPAPTTQGPGDQTAAPGPSKPFRVPKKDRRYDELGRLRSEYVGTGAPLYLPGAKDPFAAAGIPYPDRPSEKASTAPPPLAASAQKALQQKKKSGRATRTLSSVLSQERAASPPAGDVLDDIVEEEERRTPPQSSDPDPQGSPLPPHVRGLAIHSPGTVSGTFARMAGRVQDGTLSPRTIQDQPSVADDLLLSDSDEGDDGHLVIDDAESPFPPKSGGAPARPPSGTSSVQIISPPAVPTEPSTTTPASAKRKAQPEGERPTKARRTDKGATRDSAEASTSVDPRASLADMPAPEGIVPRMGFPLQSSTPKAKRDRPSSRPLEDDSTGAFTPRGWSVPELEFSLIALTALDSPTARHTATTVSLSEVLFFAAHTRMCPYLLGMLRARLKRREKYSQRYQQLYGMLERVAPQGEPLNREHHFLRHIRTDGSVDLTALCQRYYLGLAREMLADSYPYGLQAVLHYVRTVLERRERCLLGLSNDGIPRMRPPKIPENEVDLPAPQGTSSKKRSSAATAPTPQPTAASGQGPGDSPPPSPGDPPSAGASPDRPKKGPRQKTKPLRKELAKDVGLAGAKTPAEMRAAPSSASGSSAVASGASVVVATPGRPLNAFERAWQQMLRDIPQTAGTPEWPRYARKPILPWRRAGGAQLGANDTVFRWPTEAEIQGVDCLPIFEEIRRRLLILDYLSVWQANQLRPGREDEDAALGDLELLARCQTECGWEEASQLADRRRRTMCHRDHHYAAIWQLEITSSSLASAAQESSRCGVGLFNLHHAAALRKREMPGYLQRHAHARIQGGDDSFPALARSNLAICPFPTCRLWMGSGIDSATFHIREHYQLIMVCGYCVAKNLFPPAVCYSTEAYERHFKKCASAAQLAAVAKYKGKSKASATATTSKSTSTSKSAATSTPSTSATSRPTTRASTAGTAEVQGKPPATPALPQPAQTRGQASSSTASPSASRALLKQTAASGKAPTRHTLAAAGLNPTPGVAPDSLVNRLRQLPAIAPKPAASSPAESGTPTFRVVPGDDPSVARKRKKTSKSSRSKRTWLKSAAASDYIEISYDLRSHSQSTQGNSQDSETPAASQETQRSATPGTSQENPPARGTRRSPTATEFLLGEEEWTDSD